MTGGPGRAFPMNKDQPTRKSEDLWGEKLKKGFNTAKPTEFCKQKGKEANNHEKCTQEVKSVVGSLATPGTESQYGCVNGTLKN